MDLFEKALEWYQSYNEGKREAALELFPKKKLEAAVESFNKKKEKEMLEKREKAIEKNLKRCKKLFPVGTLMWSDDGTDECPNLVISEPYVKETDYSVPNNSYPVGYSGKKKSIFAKTIRLYHNEPLEGKWMYDTINLEKCLEDMDSKSEYVKHEHIIDLEKFHKNEEEKRLKKLERLKEDRDREQKNLERLNNEISDFETYDPSKMTKGYIKELLEKYA